MTIHILTLTISPLLLKFVTNQLSGNLLLVNSLSKCVKSWSFPRDICSFGDTVSSSNWVDI